MSNASADSMGGPFDYQDRWQIVRQSLRDRIIEGSLHPGEILSEVALAEHYGVSRGPIRTALQDLARVGLVTPGATRRRMSVARFDARDIDELYDVTCGIERMAVRTVASMATESDIDELYTMLRKLEEAQRSGDQNASADSDLMFHQHIVDLSGNRRLLMLWLIIAEQIRYVIATTQRADPSVAWAAFNQPIADAIAAHDPDGAERAVINIFEDAHARIRANTIGTNTVRPEGFEPPTV